MHITNSLLFLSNELMMISRHRQMGLPLHFVSFAFMEGKMFSHHWKHGTFVIQDEERWGNTVCYGALFHLDDFYFYIRLLDAYFACSMSALRTNHANDIHHRMHVDVTPIQFASLDDFSRLKYEERDTIRAFAYLGNKTHPKITQRLHAHNSYRIIDGIDKQAFIQLNKECCT